MKKVIFLSILIAILTIGLVAGVIFKTANRDFKSDPEFYKSLGNELAKNGETGKAIAVYEKSLSMREDEEVLNNLAILYNQEGEYSLAIANLRKLVELDSNNAGYQYDLAANLVAKFRNTDDKSLDDLYEALDRYTKADELSPGYEYAKENIDVLKEVLKAE